MPIESFELDAVIPAPPERVYAAWVDPKLHTAFTGSPATVEPWVGGRFTAHDGYIHGINLELSPAKRIVQTWRSSEFPVGTPDSRLAVELSPAAGGGTLIKLLHSNIPHGQGKNYKSGWVSRYFKPMVKFFVAKLGPKAASAKAARAKAAVAASGSPASAKVALTSNPAATAPARSAASPAPRAAALKKPARAAQRPAAAKPRAKVRAAVKVRAVAKRKAAPARKAARAPAPAARRPAAAKRKKK